MDVYYSPLFFSCFKQRHLPSKKLEFYFLSQILIKTDRFLTFSNCHNPASMSSPPFFCCIKQKSLAVIPIGKPNACNIFFFIYLSINLMNYSPVGFYSDCETYLPLFLIQAHTINYATNSTDSVAHIKLIAFFYYISIRCHFVIKEQTVRL